MKEGEEEEGERRKRKKRNEAGGGGVGIKRDLGGLVVNIIKIHCVKFSKNYKYCLNNRRVDPPLAEHAMLWVLGQSTVCLRCL